MTSANGEASIKTYTGLTLDYLNPTPEMIDIRDIAHALSQVCRFAAQSSEFYSVAQHSILVSRLVPEPLARWGLLHDAAEAYMGDMPRPLKRIIPYYKQIEVNLMRVIAAKFNLLPWPEPKEVKEADRIALALEGARFMTGREDEYGIADAGAAKIVGSPVAVPPTTGKVLFLTRYKEVFDLRRIGGKK